MADGNRQQEQQPVAASATKMVPRHFTIHPRHLAVLKRRAQERRLPVSAILREVLDRWIEEENVSDRTPTTGRELVEMLQANGLIGMWADRADIGDSVTFARRLRERAQTRADRADADEMARRGGAHPAGEPSD